MAKTKKKGKNTKKRYNKRVAIQAVKLVVESLIKLTMDTGLAKRKDLHIVIGKRSGKILHEFSLGKVKKWEHDYKGVARSKFNLTCRNGLPTRIIQSMMPELAGEKGDTFYFGSWIDGDIVVACSGVQAYWDEAYAKVIVAVVRAIVTAIQENEIALGKDFR